MNKQSLSNIQENERILIEGTLTEFHVSLYKEDLFKQIEKHYKEKNLISGLRSVAGDMYSRVARAASDTMYESEYSEYFICLIDDQIVCGTFGGASKLVIGKKAKLVAQKYPDVLVAKGILCESEGLVWLDHARGYIAERMANWKIGWWGFLSLFIVMGITIAASENWGTSTFWTMMKFNFFGNGAIFLIFSICSNLGISHLADEPTEIMRMLGFSNPDQINLNNYTYINVHWHELVRTSDTQANSFNVYCYKKAIEDGKIKMV